MSFPAFSTRWRVAPVDPKQKVVNSWSGPEKLEISLSEARTRRIHKNCRFENVSYCEFDEVIFVNSTSICEFDEFQIMNFGHFWPSLNHRSTWSLRLITFQSVISGFNKGQIEFHPLASQQRSASMLSRCDSGV